MPMQRNLRPTRAIACDNARTSRRGGLHVPRNVGWQRTRRKCDIGHVRRPEGRARAANRCISGPTVRLPLRMDSRPGTAVREIQEHPELFSEGAHCSPESQVHLGSQKARQITGPRKSTSVCTHRCSAIVQNGDVERCPSDVQGGAAYKQAAAEATGEAAQEAPGRGPTWLPHADGE